MVAGQQTAGRRKCVALSSSSFKGKNVLNSDFFLSLSLSPWFKGFNLFLLKEKLSKKCMIIVKIYKTLKKEKGKSLISLQSYQSKHVKYK